MNLINRNKKKKKTWEYLPVVLNNTSMVNDTVQFTFFLIVISNIIIAMSHDSLILILAAS